MTIWPVQKHIQYNKKYTERDVTNYKLDLQSNLYWSYKVENWFTSNLFPNGLSIIIEIVLNSYLHNKKNSSS